MSKEGLNEDLKTLLDNYLLTLNADDLLNMDCLESSESLLSIGSEFLVPRRERKESDRKMSIMHNLFTRTRNSLNRTNKSRHSERASMIEENYRQCNELFQRTNSEYKLQAFETPYDRTDRASNVSDDSRSIELNPQDFEDDGVRRIVSFANSEKSRTRNNRERNNRNMHQLIGTLQVNPDTITIEHVS